jgi:hypothetical protein
MNNRTLWLLLLLVFGASNLTVSASTPLAVVAGPALQRAPNVASYEIAARLDPAAKTVAGTERISYANPSQDTLSEIWLRLYLRAFRDLNTTWMKDSGGQSRGFPIQASELGDINVSKLALADGTDLLASATLTDTLMRVPLPQPLGPGQRIDLNATWVSTLPRVFARTGYGGRDNTFFMVGQWYPKMAVYDRGHWDTEPWHANAEFFNDFGSYDVRVTVPADYVVAGAGIPVGDATNADSTRTLHFTSDNVTDFAFAASPDFQTRMDTSGSTDVALYYLPEYSGMRYMIDAGRRLGIRQLGIGAQAFERLQLANEPMLPATLPASQYSSSGYVVVYTKTALGLWTLESVVGTEPFRRAMADYLSQYRFKHPSGGDFRAALEHSLGDLSWFFDDYMNGQNVIDYAAGPIENGPSGSTVQVVRKGGVRVPVDMRVTLASGAQQVKRWLDQSESVRYSFPADDPIVRVEVDPDRKLHAEINLLDNGASAAPEMQPALTLGGRLIFWLQVIVQSIGLFG